MKKYQLTSETITVNGRTLHRIQALRNFADVEKGELGGFVENESNLSQEGNCWVYDNAMVYDNAKVIGSVKIKENAIVSGTSIVGLSRHTFSKYCKEHFDLTQEQILANFYKIFSTSEAKNDFSIIKGNACVTENSVVCCNSIVEGSTIINNNSEIHNSHISGESIIEGSKVSFSTVEGCLIYKALCTADYYAKYCVIFHTEAGQSKVENSIVFNSAALEIYTHLSAKDFAHELGLQARVKFNVNYTYSVNKLINTFNFE